MYKIIYLPTAETVRVGRGWAIFDNLKSAEKWYKEQPLLYVKKNYIFYKPKKSPGYLDCEIVKIKHHLLEIIEVPDDV